MAEILDLIAEAARHCQEVEQQFSAHPPPELETVIKLHRVLLMRYSLEAEKKPEVLKELREVMKPVMDWAALQERRKQRELAEQKYRDQVEAEKKENGDGTGGALQPETMEQIERELSLL
jgi:hypothetical protein